MSRALEDSNRRLLRARDILRRRQVENIERRAPGLWFYRRWVNKRPTAPWSRTGGWRPSSTSATPAPHFTISFGAFVGRLLSRRLRELSHVTP